MYCHRRFVCGNSRLSQRLDMRRTFFGGGGGGGNKTTDSDSKKTKESASGDNNNNNKAFNGDFSNMFGGSGGFMSGFDAQKLRAMQEMISRQPLEKQAEMMRKALELQKTLGKIPGIGKFAQKNIEMMEQLLKNVETQQPEKTSANCGTSSTKGVLGSDGNTASPFSPLPQHRATGGESRNTSGPSIDELKKINLGPEIEALFAELASMRKKKNSYRDKLFAREEDLEKTQKELKQAQETEETLRARLRKAEQDVMLLNAENMELKEKEKEWRQVKQKNEVLANTVQKLQQSDAAVDRQRSDAFQVQLKEKDELLRSLQRKLERLRRRDPLLKFSRLCSNVTRLCAAECDDARDFFDDAFATLQLRYEEEQERVWEAVVTQKGLGACAYAAAVRRFFLSRLSHANYDSLVSVEGDVAALRDFVMQAGFTLQHLAAERYIIAAAEEDGDTTPIATNTMPATFSSFSMAFFGPYGVTVALYLAGKVNGGVFDMPFRLTATSPHVSMTLFNNARRARVQYDTARSSGPGGQAANVTETQITAKLLIDGKVAYVAEAQDSRSALSNREAATEKLGNVRRQQYNEQLAKQQRIDNVERELVHVVGEHYTSNNDVSADAVTPAAVVDMARGAVSGGYLSHVDFGLVCGMFFLSKSAATASMATSASSLI